MDQRPPLWSRDFIQITLLNFFLFISFQMFPAALPPYLNGLGASDDEVGLIMGVATLASIFTRPLAGIFLDRMGRKPVLLTGLGVLLVTTAALYFFPVLWIILVLRIINGMGWGLGSTASSTIVSGIVPKARFGEGMGYFSLASSMAMAIGPAVALSISAGSMIWTATFVLAVAIGIGAFLNTPALEVRAAAPVADTPGIKKKFSFSSPYEKSAVIPTVIVFLIFAVYGGVSSFVALYAYDMGIGNIGAFFTVYAIAMLLARPYSGKLVDRRGLGVVIVPGAILVFVALLMLWQATGMLWFLMAGAVFGIGKGALQTSTQAMAILHAPKHRIGAANATYYTGLDCGVGIGAITAGFLSTVVGYSNMYLIFTVFPLVSIVLYLLSVRLRRG